MMSRRQPCESAGCDSTTSELDFNSASITDRAHSGTMPPVSHFPIEHSDMEKGFSTSSSSTFDPNMKGFDTDDSCLSTLDEKKPDHTFPVSLEVASIPPPYSPLGTNNVQTYSTAAPLSVTPQQVVMEKLSSLQNYPVSILGQATLYQLSLRLDPDLLPSQNWRMMAEYMQFNNWEIKSFEREKMPTKAVIEAWARMGMHTIGEFLNILHIDMQRLDVITDVPDFILNDARRHQNSTRRSLNSDSSLIPPYARSESASSQSSLVFSSSFHSLPSYGDPAIVEVDFSEKPGGQNFSRPVQVPEVQPSTEQKYDAFVLCNIADTDFVCDQFLPKVEVDAKIKLCLAERDIPPGNLNFNDQLDYMFERSRKLVVILSDEFFQSREHDWQSNLAISQDPVSRKQRIIPIKYKKVNNRNIFDHLGCCDLTKTMKEQWFWDKIINGIKAK